MRLSHGLVGLVLACAIGAVAPRGAAQTSGVPPILAGVYEYPTDVSAGRDLVIAAMEPQLAGLPSFVRGLVRDQLESRIVIPRRITVALPDPIVSVTYESDRTVVVSSPLGATTTVMSRDGEPIPVTQRLASGWLEQTFEGPNGRLRLLLSTEPDGETLHADGTVSGERLPTPIPVRLDYRRVH